VLNELQNPARHGEEWRFDYLVVQEQEVQGPDANRRAFLCAQHWAIFPMALIIDCHVHISALTPAHG